MKKQVTKKAIKFKPVKDAPEGIWIISVFMFASALMTFVFAGLAFKIADMVPTINQYLSLLAETATTATISAGIPLLMGILLLVMAVIDYMIGRCLLRGRRWAWAVMVILSGVALIGAISGIIQGMIWGSIFTIIVYGLILWYLLSKNTKKFYD